MLAAKHFYSVFSFLKRILTKIVLISFFFQKFVTSYLFVISNDLFVIINYVLVITKNKKNTDKLTFYQFSFIRLEGLYLNSHSS